MSQYMRVLVLAGIVPFLLSFWSPLRFWRNKSALVSSIGLVVIIFGAWDVLATLRGHWYFNPKGVWHFRIFNLPVEEVLFFVVIPFCCIFTWEAINYIKKAMLK